MRPRRSRKPPTPPKPEIIRLVDELEAEIRVHGSATVPLEPFLAAARSHLTLRYPEGTDETPEGFVALVLDAREWVWEIAGEDLVVELPGWVDPRPALVAVQPGLFD